MSEVPTVPPDAERGAAERGAPRGTGSARPRSAGLAPRQDLDVPAVQTALRAVYDFDYTARVDQVRTLYANALERQWIALRDLDWEQGIDRDAFARTFSLAGLPIQRTAFWQNLDAKLRWEVSRRTSAFQLSNFLHGEQGALMVASQLVNAVPDMDAKFYTATQTLDEARHVEVFSAYIELLDEIHPVDPAVKDLLDATLSHGDWMHQAVGMQVVIEGLALYLFRDMRNVTQEPLLKQLLTLVSRDEARHTGFGIRYLSRVLPRIDDRTRRSLEDFAFEGSRLLISARNGHSVRETVLSIWRDVGLDPALVFQEVGKEREKLLADVRRTGAMGPVQGFLIPTMRSIGLLGERLERMYQDLFAADRPEAERRQVRFEVELPDDLEAWVLSGA